MNGAAVTATMTEAAPDSAAHPVSDAEVAAAIRIDQSVTIVRMIPLMVISNVAVPLVIVINLRDALPLTFALLWPGLLLAMNLPVAISWLRLRNRPRPVSISARRIRSIAISSSAIGIVIAAGAFYIFPRAGASSQIVVEICLLGLWAGAMIATWKIPQALFGFVTPLAVSMIAALLINWDTALAATEVLVTLLVFSALVTWAVNIHQTYYRESTRTQLEHGTQSAEIERRRQVEAQLKASMDELHATQDKLILQEKMASLGALTAGVAHEIKNPLNFIINFARLSTDLVGDLRQSLEPAKAQLDEDDRIALQEDFDLLADNIEKIAKHGQRADGIVKSMLMHSRSDPGTMAPSKINPLVEEAVDLAFHGGRAQDPSFNVQIETELDPAIPVIHGSSTQLMRVLLNLIRNGYQAARQRARTAGPDFEPVVRVSTKLEGQYILIRVRDNGTGIDPAVRPKLFQPFFTTKPPGEGTGLGLSVSYDIVAKHGGDMTVESVPGEYAEFIVTLPTNPAGVIALAEARKKQAEAS